MRLKTINGSIKNVTEVIAAVETRFNFNGTKRRLFEACKDGSVKPTALVFAFDDRVQPMGMFQPFSGCEDKLVLGNLTAEKAGEIVDALLKEGYADISKLKLQKHQYDLNKYVVDDGVSDAYAVSTNCSGMIFTNTNGMVDIFNPNGVDVDEDDSVDCEMFGEGEDE